MAKNIYTDPAKRQDFMFLFDVTNGNPNGDPDAGNLPRVDPETMHGMVTDVAIKRKIRGFIDIHYGAEPGYNIYVQQKGVLSEHHARAQEAIEREDPSVANLPKDKKKNSADLADKRRDWMCRNFYDIRTFGAVLSVTDYPSGQVRGPLQVTFARSIDPIVPLDISITRVAITNKDENREQKVSEMGRKSLTPYALFAAYGFFSPHFAQATHFQEQDFERFWEALIYCWDSDHSASRGMMSLRGLYVFTHENARGNAPSHELFSRIQIENTPHARSFQEYSTIINTAALPDGVTLTKLMG